MWNVPWSVRSVALTSLSLAVLVPSASAAAVQEYPLPPGSAPRDLASGPGATLWVASGQGLLRVSTGGLVTPVVGGGFPGLAAPPNAIAPGRPDRLGRPTLLFTESDDENDSDGVLGRVDANGRVQQLSAEGLTTPPAFTDVTNGPDGSIAFLAAQLPTVGLYAEDEDGPGIFEGLFDEMDSDPRAIATGADGSTLWYTGGDNGVVGRAIFDDEFSGTNQEFAVGGPAEDIVLGPDDALWFTLPEDHAIGRLDPATSPPTITRYTSGLSSSAQPTGITVGPDKAIWFTDAGSSAGVGRLDPATGVSAVTSDGVTPGSTPQRIATGPDGALWFTERDADRVGRIAVDAFKAPTPPVEPPPPATEPPPAPPVLPAPVAPEPVAPAPVAPAPPVLPVAPSPPVIAPRPPALRLSGITRSVRVREPRRATLRFRLNVAATYTVTVTRRTDSAATTRAVVRPGRTISGRAGGNLVTLPALPVGRYRVEIRAATADGRTARTRARVRVLRRPRSSPSFTG